jgi:CubicO group peptidase (beta-lactamase class C family)
MPKPTLPCLGALLALLFIAAAEGPAAGAPAAPADPTALEHTLLPTLVVEGVPPWTLAERMRHYHVPGVSIAVIQGGTIAWARGYGVLDVTSKAPVTAKTLFQAASLSKPVTAMTVLRLADQGKLSLVAPVNSLLKSWKLPDGPFSAGVTLERILSHSAGLTVGGFSGYSPGAILPTLVQTLNGRPPANNRPVRADIEPGTNFRYSGGGYEIAQQLLVDVTGQPFAALVHDTVLGPAGMEDSFFEQPLSAELVTRAASGYGADGAPLPGKWHVYPELAAAGLWTTAADLARFAIAVQQSHAGAKGALLSKAMATRMLTVASAGDLGLALGNGLGLFVEQRGKGTFGHVSMEQPGGAEGFRSLLVASTAGGYGVVVMTNGDGGSKLADEIVRGAAQVYGWSSLGVPQLKRTHPSDEQLRKLSGRYRVGTDEVLTVSASRNSLKVQPLLDEAFEIFPVEGGDFVRPDPPTHYAFDPAGLVAKKLFVEQNGVRINPGDSTPLQLLLAGRVEPALAGYRKLKDLDSTDPSVAELRLNDIGYQLQASAPEKALAIFRLNAELYPASPNTWDSLAEAFLGAGKKAEALRAYQKVLETVPKDTHLPSELKTTLLETAEAKVKELEGK